MPKLATTKAPAVFANAGCKGKDYTIADGRGLSMLVTKDGQKLWIFRYRVSYEDRPGAKSVERKIAIKGGYPTVSVRAAREEAERMREMLARGEDPGAIRNVVRQEANQQKQLAREESARNANTFEKVARDWHAREREHLVPIYADEIMRRLERNIFPMLGAMPIAEIKAPDILIPLREIESRGARETAHRTLGVCGQIFRFAIASGILEKDPSSDLRGALARPVEKHFGALTEPEKIAPFLQRIDAYNGTPQTRIALWLSVYTFVRPGNLQTARWDEFRNLKDPAHAEWRIPSAKMKIKGRGDFIIPLAPQVVRLVESLRPVTGTSPYLFPSVRDPSLPMSNMTVLKAIRTMGYSSDEMTGHGVRAMAMTNCVQELGFKIEVVDEQLAHGKKGPLRGAYDRTTYMSERSRLMHEWADYLDKLKGQLIATSASTHSDGTGSADRIAARIRRSGSATHA